MTRAAGICALAAACRTTSSSVTPKTASARATFVYGAFVDGKLVGAAELRSNQAIWSEQAPFGRHIHAEAAFSVDDGYRRRGIGEKLFKRILRAATNHGVETIEIVCLPENVGMQNLAKKFQRAFRFRGELADRPPDGAPADRVFADSVKPRATRSTLAPRCSTPTGGRWRRRGKRARNAEPRATSVSLDPRQAYSV